MIKKQTLRRFTFLYSLAVIATIVGVLYPLTRVWAAASPLAGVSFYVNPNNNNAASQAAQWRMSRPSDAALMDRIAQTPQAFWMGDWTPNSQQVAADYTNRAAAAGATGVIVAYNIPNRDCGSYSAGGTDSVATYETWIDGLAAGIGNHPTLVVVEPDAIAQINCLDTAGTQARFGMLSYAVTRLKSSSSTLVYLDAGNAGWLSAATAASRLQQANIAAADGFSLNVSSFYKTSDTTTYGAAISSGVGGKHFVIDTSRNGAGSNGTWCNPPGRALGATPTATTNSALVDAYLWIKTPGESDGTCNSGPRAGTWWPDYALGLAQQTQTKQQSVSVPVVVPKVATHAIVPHPNTVVTSTSAIPVIASPNSEHILVDIVAPTATNTVLPLLHVSGSFTVPYATNSNQAIVSVDGRSISGTVLDTRYLANGLHSLVIRVTDQSGHTVSHTVRITVYNALNTWEQVRNTLLSFLQHVTDVAAAHGLTIASISARSNIHSA
jgi:endoglucanase